MTRPSPEPQTRLREQALRLRRIWRGMSPPERAALVPGLSTDELGQAWHAILEGAHPFADWLDDDAAWPPEQTWSGASPRALVTSHPFARRTPWSNPATSGTSSSTQRAS